jgi:aspartate aminotransferase-like enzyme
VSRYLLFVAHNNACIAPFFAVYREALGVDVLITAPQKGWSGPACAALVCLSAAARAKLDVTESSSFICDLGKWTQITEAYTVKHAHAYHATMPTDALVKARDAMAATEAFGFEKVRAAADKLGAGVRAALRARGIGEVSTVGCRVFVSCSLYHACLYPACSHVTSNLSHVGYTCL